MFRSRHLVAAILAAALLLVGGISAPADDVFPAPWRGEGNTTLQATTFSQSGNLVWESVDNDYGTPEIWMYEDTWQWNAEAEGRSGVVSWTSAGSHGQGFSMNIPNTPDPNRQKLIWIQVTYRGDAASIWEAVGMGAGGGSWGPGLAPLVDSFTHNDGWITDARWMVLAPNPPGEFIGVRWSGAGMVDQLIVETICVPEPTTWALLAAGAACLALASRRRGR